MVAAFDIGNSNIHLGLYRNGYLIKWSAMPVETAHIEHNLTRLLVRRSITSAAIVSVVPGITPKVVHFLKHRYKILPMIISAKSCRYLKYAYRRPATLGADRIANAVGGLERYRKNLLVISFGTATTLDVVLKDGHHMGGIITPGIGLLLNGLSTRTALLRKVKLKKPYRYIGRSTEECIQSGLVNGSIVMIQGLIENVKRECKRKLMCVATGGWGELMTRYIEQIDAFDQDLSTYGVYKIYEFNS